jgi:hypothetical protein
MAGTYRSIAQMQRSVSSIENNPKPRVAKQSHDGTGAFILNRSLIDSGTAVAAARQAGSVLLTSVRRQSPGMVILERTLSAGADAAAQSGALDGRTLAVPMSGPIADDDDIMFGMPELSAAHQTDDIHARPSFLLETAETRAAEDDVTRLQADPGASAKQSWHPVATPFITNAAVAAGRPRSLPQHVSPVQLAQSMNGLEQWLAGPPSSPPRRPDTVLLLRESHSSQQSSRPPSRAVGSLLGHSPAQPTAPVFTSSVLRRTASMRSTSPSAAPAGSPSTDRALEGAARATTPAAVPGSPSVLASRPAAHLFPADEAQMHNLTVRSTTASTTGQAARTERLVRSASLAEMDAVADLERTMEGKSERPFSLLIR